MNTSLAIIHGLGDRYINMSDAEILALMKQRIGVNDIMLIRNRNNYGRTFDNNRKDKVMEDLIKRKDAIKAEADIVYKVLHSEGCKETYEDCLADAEKTFKDIPSAEPKQEWIPCSERLPEEEGHYLVTFGAFAETINDEKVIFGDIDRSVSEIGYGCYERDIFWQPTAFGWYDLGTATPFDKRAIIAWMPLPKPWKGADDE